MNGSHGARVVAKATKKASSKAPSSRRPPRTERSAGVLVYLDGGDAAVDRRFLLLDYGRYWDYPKGHVEQGEDDQTAALRELAEETGISDVQLDPAFRQEIIYFFRHPKKGLVRKTVVFFLASTRSQQVTLSHEHVGFDWVPEDDVPARLKYKTARQVFEAAKAFLSSAPGG